MGDTVRLFLISCLSLLLRWGTRALLFYTVYTFFESGVLMYFLENYNDWLVYSVTAMCIVTVFFVLFLFISAVRLGEQFLYFTKAEGGKGRFLLLFHFCTFKRSLRAFSLYFKLGLLKCGWLFYYLLPSLVCYGITFYLYSYGNILPSVFYILIAGGSALSAFSLFMWRVTFFRYNAAPYYVCLNREITPKKAVKKSIHFTDGYLRESVLLESSFFGWFLSCITVFPIVYVLPYFKISKALFVSESLNSHMYSQEKSKYAINYIGLK